MSVFHAPAHCASHSERGEQALARLVEQVNALRARPVTGEDFEGVERECVFRSKPITDSGATRSPIPAQADHRFRSNPITDSGPKPITFRR